jgi:hydrogenase/urease accessory protein HupE
MNSSPKPAFQGIVSRLILALTLILAGAATVAQAHDPGLSSVSITLKSQGCEAVLIFSKVDAQIVLQSMTKSDRSLGAQKIAAGLKDFAAGALEFTPDGHAVQPQAVHASADAAGNVIFQLSYEFSVPGRISVRSRWLEILPPGHREFLSVQGTDGATLAGRLLSANSEAASVDIGQAAAEAKPVRKTAFGSFWAMGVMHIWTGYDHLLFLFGLLAVTRRLATVLKIITCFTVAHSLTLAIATLNLIEIPSRIVEPLIAASIVFVGLENFLRNGEPTGRWLLTFAFGLIHGFGFASALRESGVGSHSGGIAVPLISFNLGVECGQIAIAAVALPIIWKLRDQPRILRGWIPATSCIVGVLGTYWFVQRVF